MDVEVDLYSGRPNPHFRLEPPQAAELQRRLAGLPPTSLPRRPRAGLGYRGLVVRPPAGQPPSAEVVVSAGVVVVRDRNGAESALADEHRDLERWLVDAGAAGLDPALASLIRQDLSS